MSSLIVTYTSISSDYEEPSDAGSLGVVVYEYNRLPMHPVDPYVEAALQAPEQAPPFLDYAPGPEHPPSSEYVLTLRSQSRHRFLQTMSSSKFSRDQTSNPTSSTNPTPKGRIRQNSKQKVENSNFEENPLPLVPIDENQTMAQLLQAPTGGEAWDRFKDLLRVCPRHGFSELHQLDIFYNALNSKDQDSMNYAAGVSTDTSTSGISPDVAELKDLVKALLLDKKSQNQAHAPVKAVEERASTLSSGTLPRNIIANSRSDLKAITTRSGVSYDRPQIPPLSSFVPKWVENKPEATKDTMNPTNNESTKDVQPQVVQYVFPILNSEPVTSAISEPVIAPVSAPKPNPKSSIPYPSRRNDERNREK
nr:reverse transcriptase domain-containing protein [Tanacetum cinerariifolium]